VRYYGFLSLNHRAQLTTLRQQLAARHDRRVVHCRTLCHGQSHAGAESSPLLSAKCPRTFPAGLLLASPTPVDLETINNAPYHLRLLTSEW